MSGLFSECTVAEASGGRVENSCTHLGRGKCLKPFQSTESFEECLAEGDVLRKPDQSRKICGVCLKLDGEYLGLHGIETVCVRPTLLRRHIYLACIGNGEDLQDPEQRVRHETSWIRAGNFKAPWCRPENSGVLLLRVWSYQVPLFRGGRSKTGLCR